MNTLLILQRKTLVNLDPVFSLKQKILVLMYVQHQVMDSDSNSSKLMDITVLWRYCDEEFMNSLHSISLSIYNVSAIMSGACNTVRSELTLKLMKLKFFIKIFKYKVCLYFLRGSPRFYKSQVRLHENWNLPLMSEEKLHSYSTGWVLHGTLIY